MRKCGECSVCCVIGAVPELEKPAHTPCQFIKKNSCGSCSIFNKKDLPNTCKNYRCAWLNNFGNEENRPDKCGVMFTRNLLENQIYYTAIEIEKNAIHSDVVKNMWIQISECEKIPIIVISYDKKPPHDTGDFIIIHDDIIHRCSRIAGNLHYKENNIGFYNLIKGS